MSILYNGDCLEEMKQIEDNSIDLIFVDLPYGQTSCKWDVKIDLTKMWEQYMRIKKTNTPIFFTTTTKFGVDIINSAPKKCPFRYDIVWCKSSPAGFLCAKKMPMRKHEMVYVFYEKLPFYDLSSHKHKFIKETKSNRDENSCYGALNNEKVSKYDPPLPVSVVKEEKQEITYGEVKQFDKLSVYGETKLPSYLFGKDGKRIDAGSSSYDPPLPTSVVKEPESKYIPPQLRESKYVGKPVMRENTTYGDVISYEIKERKNGESRYDPPLPVSVVKEPEHKWVKGTTDTYGKAPTEDSKECGGHQQRYEPPLPTTMLEIKSTRGKHSTEKPVALMEWVLKYYSKEGDVVLDNCMGSGSTGVACRNMNRNFIGIEKDPEIYEVAFNRINID